MLDIKCSTLHNPLINWLAPKYDRFSHTFVIPGRGRIPLTAASMCYSVGLPRGHLPIRYAMDSAIESRLRPVLFPGLPKTPETTSVFTILKEMTAAYDSFKQIYVMYLVSTVLAPTSFNKVSGRCYPIMDKVNDVKNMNMCQFVRDKLHEELSLGKLSAACLLHMMVLMLLAIHVIFSYFCRIILGTANTDVNKKARNATPKRSASKIKKQGSRSSPRFLVKQLDNTDEINISKAATACTVEVDNRASVAVIRNVGDSYVHTTDGHLLLLYEISVVVATAMEHGDNIVEKMDVAASVVIGGVFVMKLICDYDGDKTIMFEPEHAKPIRKSLTYYMVAHPFNEKMPLETRKILDKHNIPHDFSKPGYTPWMHEQKESGAEHPYESMVVF